MQKVSDLFDALNVITGGRMVASLEEAKEGNHPFVILKSSGIYGKDVLEIPGLIHGDPDKEIKKVAVCMTMTELSIELAGATGVDAIVAHHPIADAASCGGVTLKDYLDLYEIAALECHEAFHGLHPGIAYLHGHKVIKSDISYGGIHGNVMFVGEPFSEIQTMGDMLDRLDAHMCLEDDAALLEAERRIKGVQSIEETSLLTRGRVLVGQRASPVSKILHIFPHTGFTKEHLRQAIIENPDVDTVLASISRVYEGHELINEARSMGLNFMVGNSHVLEILENGLPLAYALDQLLEDVEIVVFRDRVTSTPLANVGHQQLKDYARQFSEAHLLGNNILSCHS
ncbi:Nif3-like dinuclear metal center hexameric protein [Paenalcaligenes niemegkensis]|uniref:Nif3-like dinuclear metal center hexameric protein n=1 Tax=Paenalcaligenes niemegkensis TaxID=2895469 RepID=UPI001EE81557|nr:Nif3-like dinuclear metal center hexameric protein [Paenalcaligenes niemegkensis]MCQ9617742.1 Nif3-like dinuclear metal center hexameric protein [Paenalcaligenes niemegkensis]